MNEVEGFSPIFVVSLVSKFVMEHNLKESMQQLSPDDRSLKMMDEVRDLVWDG